MKRRSILAVLLAAPFMPTAAKAADPGPDTEALEPHSSPLDGVDLTMETADIGQIDAGIIRSASGCMLIGFGTGYITIAP
jgi:hypothetical protein